MSRRPLARLAIVLPVVVLAAACGGGDGDAAGGTDPDHAEHTEQDAAALGAPRDVCRADAKALTPPYDPSFPTAWTFPADTTVYDAREVAGAGVVVTAITSTPFDDVLDHLNTVDAAAGFKVTQGETEEDDAEADWASADQRGRWTIRKNASCPGETTIQVAVFD